MYKKIKKLCSVLCSSMCLLGGANANSLNKNLKVGVPSKSPKSLSDKKECVSLELKDFLDDEEKRLKNEIGNQSSFRWEMLDLGSLSRKSKKLYRSKGALGAIINSGKVLGYLKALDSNSLRKLSEVGKGFSNGSYIASYFPLVFGIVFSVIEAFRPELNEIEINKLLTLDYEFGEDLNKLLSHFGYSLNLVSGILPNAEEGVVCTKEIRLLPGNTEVERANNIFRILLLAQVKSLFRLLPQDVEAASNNLNSDAEIHNMIKFHWVKLGLVSIFSYLFSTFLGTTFNVASQYNHGFSEEVNVLADKIDELQKSISKNKSQKINNPSEGSNSLTGSKSINLKPNVNRRKISGKKGSLNKGSDIKDDCAKVL